MAENWNLAFGRYLRTLRERCGLSLNDVCSLSQTFAESVDKGYLSRCENGHHRLAFSKVIPLSKIYHVPSDVLLERMEADMELDRVGGPDTEEMAFEALNEAGAKAVQQGFKWHGYAYLREAVIRAPLDPLRPRFQERSQQIACAQMNCATGALDLGKFRLALHEFRHLESSGTMSRGLHPVLLERLSCALRSQGHLDESREYAEKAIICGEEQVDSDMLGYLYSSRARQAQQDSDRDLAAAFQQKAYETYRKMEQPYEAARSLCNLAQLHYDLGRHQAARRTLLAAEKAIRPLDQHRTRALIRILWGELDELDDKGHLAERRWKEAAAIARELNDKVLMFKAEFFLLRRARKVGNEAAARAIQRRLERLSNYVPENVSELQDYARLQAAEVTIP